MFEVPPSFPFAIGVSSIDNLPEFNRREVIGRLLRDLHRFHFLGRISKQPIVLHAEIEKTVEAVAFPLRGQGAVVPPSPGIPPFCRSQFIWKGQGLLPRPTEQLSFKQRLALAG